MSYLQIIFMIVLVNNFYGTTCRHLNICTCGSFSVVLANHFQSHSRTILGSTRVPFSVVLTDHFQSHSRIISGLTRGPFSVALADNFQSHSRIISDLTRGPFSVVLPDHFQSLITLLWCKMVSKSNIELLSSLTWNHFEVQIKYSQIQFLNGPQF